tara:strand:- start:100 stop:327 length:228 start_codon:yes stop_codon:yes gene_type:complete
MENFKKSDLLMIINKYENYINNMGAFKAGDNIDKLYFEIAKEDLKNIDLHKQRETLNNIFDLYGDVFANNNQTNE